MALCFETIGRCWSFAQETGAPKLKAIKVRTVAPHSFNKYMSLVTCFQDISWVSLKVEILCQSVNINKFSSSTAVPALIWYQLRLIRVRVCVCVGIPRGIRVGYDAKKWLQLHHATKEILTATTVITFPPPSLGLFVMELYRFPFVLRSDTLWICNI